MPCYDMHYYVEQHPSFALGNFINCTPALRYLAERDCKPVPVLFNTDYVRECFLDCPFIEHIEAPKGKRLFGSELKCKANTEPDYAYIFRQVTGRLWSEEWHTYVDQPAITARSENGMVCFINGSGSERAAYVESKDIGAAPWVAALAMAPKLCFVGSDEDRKRNPWHVQGYGHKPGIRGALIAIANSTAVIANDTGLAHAAGAMNKPLLVLWKDTPFPRCSNPGKNTTYAFDNHVQAVLDFLATFTCN